MSNGGRFDFDDGGTYCGGWEDGKAHGHGLCTGPKGQGEYSGAWQSGYEVSGVYVWPSGTCYEGQWQNGKRHGLGVERRDRRIYRGEWSLGTKGRYGIQQSTHSQARYEGTWANGLQDGIGMETYADGGTYQGQWQRGIRHGYGVRRSAQYATAIKSRSRSHLRASLASLRSEDGDNTANTHFTDGGKGKRSRENRGGFVLHSPNEHGRRRRSLSERSVLVKKSILQGLGIKKQRSTGDISQQPYVRSGPLRTCSSTRSCTSDESGVTGFSGHHDHDHASFEEPVDPNVVETYSGEWKNDRRSGYGISERSDGLKYEGEWSNNKKNGYGVMTFKDGTIEEGKYKGNVLVAFPNGKNPIFVRSSKLRERIDDAVTAANRAAQLARQKAENAVTRAATSRDRAKRADTAAVQASEDSNEARLRAKQYAPDFPQPGVELVKKLHREEKHIGNHITPALTVRTPTLSTHPARNYIGVGANERHPVSNVGQPSPVMDDQNVDRHSAASRKLILSRLQQPGFEIESPRPDHPIQNEFYNVPDAVTAFNEAQIPFHASLAGIQRQQMEWGYNQRINANEQYIQHDPYGIRHEQFSPVGTGSPSIDRRPSQSSSRYSLNQILSDHFEQYSTPANTNPISQAKAIQANTPGQRIPVHALDDTATASSSRRSTMQSSRADWRIGLEKQEKNGGAVEGDLLQQRMHNRKCSDSTSRGSMPDVSGLDKAPIRLLSREEISRLSSKRRQELHRMRQEEEFVWNKPVKYLNPVQTWVVQWKVPLLVVLFNMALTLVFYYLLTYSNADGPKRGATRHH